MRIAAGLLALSSCVHTPELPHVEKVRIENPGSILAELAATTAQVQRLVDDGQFIENPQTPDKTDRIALVGDARELLSLSGYPKFGNPDKPSCLLEIGRTLLRDSRADPTNPDSRIFVGFYPQNPTQNLRLERKEREEVFDSIECRRSAEVTSCTYSYGGGAQKVPPDMVSDLLVAADSACNAFRQAQ